MVVEDLTIGLSFPVAQLVICEVDRFELLLLGIDY